MTQEVALTEAAPLSRGQSFADLVQDLMWVSSVDYDAVWNQDREPVEGLFKISGRVKPNPKSPGLEAWMNSVTRNYLRILKLITEAGGVYTELPRLDIDGYTKYKMDDYPAPHWEGMQANIVIELRIPL